MAPPHQPEPKPALRGASPRALPLGLVLAALLHGGMLSVAVLTARQLLPTSAPLQTAPREALTLLADDPLPAEVPADLPVSPTAAAPSAAAPAASGASSRVAAVAPPRLAAQRRAASGAAPNSPSSAASSGADVEGVVPSVEGVGGATEDAAGSAAARAPSLSLEQLGVGKNPFLTPPPAISAAEQRAALGRRIDHVLRDGLAQHDQQLGLGPEGPAVAKVTELVMQSATRPNTSALLSLRTDASGQVVHVEVAEASADTDGWNDIARGLLQGLRGKKLRVPGGTGGVTMQLRVDSRVQLPSGADPGLAIDLFGQDIKKGEGDRSTRISLLKPKIVLETVQLGDDPRTKIPVVGLSLTIISVLGDPTDIGAAARRVVHAHLVSMETHPVAAE